MKAKYLIPAFLRPIGFILAIPGLILGALYLFKDYELPGFGFELHKKGNFFLPSFENFTNELALTMIVLGLLFIAFARLKKEDELTAKLRLDALYWGVLINYLVYLGLFVIILINAQFQTSSGFLDLNPLVESPWYIYNVCTPLIIFICRYFYLLYFKKELYVITTPKFFNYKPWGLIGKVFSLPLIVFIMLTLLFAERVKWLGEVGMYAFYIAPLFLLLWAFSKTNNEDEMMGQLRQESWQIATYLNYFLLIVLSFFVYGLDYYLVLFANFITLLLFFIISFEYKKYKFLRSEMELMKRGMMV